MANTNNPNGFLPYNGPSGGAGQPVVEYFNLAAANSAIGIGCPVTSSSGYVDKATASSALIGIAAEAKAASAGGTIAVWSDPNQRFVAQCDDTTGTCTTVAGAQSNADFVAGTPSSGRSTAEIDESSSTTTAALPFKLLYKYPAIDNAYGQYVRWVVKINNHQLGSSTGTAGT